MPPNLDQHRKAVDERDIARTTGRFSTVPRTWIRDVGRGALAMTALAAMAVAVGACSSDGETGQPAGGATSTSASGPRSIPKEQVAQNIGQKLAAQVGQQPKKVECPQDLPAQQGASIKCVLTADDDSTVGVTAAVTSVGNPSDLSSVSYDITADPTAIPAPRG